jgi:hypothetical protein
MSERKENELLLFLKKGKGVTSLLKKGVASLCIVKMTY